MNRSRAFARICNSVLRRKRSPLAQTPSQSTVEPSLSSAQTTSVITLEKKFLESALQKLTESETATLSESFLPTDADVTRVIKQAYDAALDKQQDCQSKRWTWTFLGKEIVLRDEAAKVVKVLQTFASVGDVIANVDPLHVGLPWAGIRVLLKATVAESDQMAALLVGMRLTLSIANRLEAYFHYYQRICRERLPSKLATDNFEKALVDMYAHVLQFLAAAIQAYDKNMAGRTWGALWKTSVIEDFKNQCENLADSTDIEANNCDRDLAAQDREKAEQWKAELKNKLDDIQSAIRSVAVDLQVKIDLSKLRTATGATYDSHADEHKAQCLAGTRTDLLDQIVSWANDPNGKSIYWLCGKAGTGKTTISRTVADRLHKQGRLGASFFYKRGEIDRGNASRFFPTIALQLADTVPGMAQSVAKALDKDSLLCERNLKEQYEKLLLEPLLIATRSGLSSVMVVVIDALDECDRPDDIRVMLKLLARVRSEVGVSLRVFVTSRPETPIQLEFKDTNGSLHEDVMLEEAQAPTIEQDIRVYMRHRFREIRNTHASLQNYDEPLPAEWPGEDTIDGLVKLAKPLFIYAFTVCRYVSQGRPQVQLQSLMGFQSGTSLSALDQMYTAILDRMLQQRDVLDRDQVLDKFRLIVGSIAMLADPLSADSLAKILEVTRAEIGETLQPLYSILHVPSSSGSPIRLLHLSFRDYLIAIPRTKPPHEFHIDEAQSHTELARRCLERLRHDDTLRYDVCQVGKPGARRTTFSADYVANRIRPDIAYACCHWAWHTFHSKQELYDDGQEHNFLLEHFLHWIESLSWLNQVSSAIRYLSQLRSKAKGLRLAAFLNDANRFLMRNRRTIDEAPLQVYHSALIFAPVESVIRMVFASTIPQPFCVLSKLPSKWSAEIHKIEGSHMPNPAAYTVAFSPDGRLVATGCSFRTLILWNAETGEIVWKIKDVGVGRLVFSTDGQMVISTSLLSRDWHTTAWNVLTGEMIRENVHSVPSGDPQVAGALSPNGRSIAVVSNSHVVRIHDIGSGKQTHSFEEDCSAITALIFLLDDRTVASGHLDGTIRLWDVQSGKQTQKLGGHRAGVVEIAVSPSDVQVMASASEDGTVCLWNAYTGRQVYQLSGDGGHARRLGFSFESRFLACVLDDRTIQLWDVETGEQVVKIERSGQTDDFQERLITALSPVEQVMAATTSDQGIQIWDMQTGKLIRELDGYTGTVAAMVLSPDGSTLASSSYDGMIRQWNMSTGEEKLPRIETDCRLLAYSRDGLKIASTSRSGDCVRLWDARTGEQIQILGDFNHRIQEVTFLPFANGVIVTSEHQTTRLWDAETGKQISQFTPNDSKPVAAISADEQWIAAGTQHGIVELWRVDTADRTLKLRAGDTPVLAVVFSPDARVVASAVEHGPVRIWTVQTGKQLSVFENSGAIREIHGTAFSPDSHIVAIHHTESVQLWNVQTGKAVQNIRLTENYSRHIAVSPGGRVVALSRGRVLVLFDVLTGQQTQRLEGHSELVLDKAFSPDGRVMVSGSQDGTVRLWDIHLNNGTQQLGGHGDAVFSVRFSPDGQTVVSRSLDHTVRLWDASTTLERQNLRRHASAFCAQDFSPDSSILASLESDGPPLLWRIQTGEFMQSPDSSILELSDSRSPEHIWGGERRPRVSEIAWLKSGRPAMPWTVNFNMLRLAIYHTGRYGKIAFSPDGQIIAIAKGKHDTTLGLWNVQTGEQIWEKKRGVLCRALDFSPNGQLLALGLDQDDPSLELWNVQTGERILSSGHHEYHDDYRFADNLSFSPDGQVIALANSDRLLLCDAQTGEEMQRFKWPRRSGKVSYYYQPIFSRDRRCVSTNYGIFLLDWTPSGSLPINIQRTTGVELWNRWIRHQGQDVIYLPHEYRGTCFDVHGDMLVIGQTSGAVTFIRLTAPE